MLSVESLYVRGCVKGLIQVLAQVPSRLAARSPLGLTDSSVAALVLWTLLRWERTFLLVALEDMWVDMWGLTRDVDVLLEEEKARAAPSQSEATPSAASTGRQADLDRHLEALLDRATREAEALGHDYLGTEHLLLAIIAGADSHLSSVLLRHDITHERLKHAVVELLRQATVVAEIAGSPRPTAGPRGARWDSPAVGVPRRFGMAVLMLLMTMYAVLFATMTLLDANPPIFIVVAILFTGVGLGQMLLFEGKYPRAASVWVGGCLFPLEILGALLIVVFFVPAVRGDVVPWLLILLILSPALGAGFGYLAGGLTAGVFLLIERYREYRGNRQGT